VPSNTAVEVVAFRVALRSKHCAPRCERQAADGLQTPIRKQNGFYVD
jgi:hypothetical protein